MDAQTLFREGISALRDKQDAVQARQLLMQSLKLDPKNEMAWLWLSRTTDDPQKQLQCIERALKVNPMNAQALTLRAKLLIAAQPANDMDWRQRLEPASVPPPPEPEEEEPEEPPARPTLQKPTVAQQRQIDRMMAKAEAALAGNDVEAALEQWLRVLEIQVDHPVAMQKAVPQLFKMKYQDDARELIWRALNAGTTSVPIHLTAIDIARYQGNHNEADDLREQVALLPTADDDLVIKMADYFFDQGQTDRGITLLETVTEQRPDSQKLLLRMGDLYDHTFGRKAEAMLYYERAARLKSGTKEAKDVEKILRNFTPVMTDRERGSFALAAREALGVGAFFLLLGWQDAGLNLLNLGMMRWLGVALSILGGYLVVTAFSSPQQQPLAKWLGGHVPENPPPPPPKEQVLYQEEVPASGVVQDPTYIPIIPPSLRALIAVGGVVVLAGAFILVFSMSIHLLGSPVQPYIPSVYDIVTETAP